MALGASFLLIADGPYRWVRAAFFLSAAAIVWIGIGVQPIRVSEYKGLSYALRMPDAKVVAETQSPLSVVTAVSSSQIRETPGQVSHRYSWSVKGSLP